jgi:Nuclease A inhibitor-like protein
MNTISNTINRLLTIALFALVLFACLPTPASAQATPSSPTVTIATPSVFSQLQKAVKGLIYSSESDSQITAIQAEASEVKNAQSAQEAALALYAKANPTVTDENLEVKSVVDFFATVTIPQAWWGEEERAQAEKFKILIAVLQKLDGVQAFKIGNGPEKTVYIIGTDASKPGSFVGVTLNVTES